MGNFSKINETFHVNYKYSTWHGLEANKFREKVSEICCPWDAL
jgi:hypothetical protein